MGKRRRQDNQTTIVQTVPFGAGWRTPPDAAFGDPEQPRGDNVTPGAAGGARGASDFVIGPGGGGGGGGGYSAETKAGMEAARAAGQRYWTDPTTGTNYAWGPYGYTEWKEASGPFPGTSPPGSNWADTRRSAAPTTWGAAAGQDTTQPQFVAGPQSAPAPAPAPDFVVGPQSAPAPAPAPTPNFVVGPQSAPAPAPAPTPTPAPGARVPGPADLARQATLAQRLREGSPYMQWDMA